MSAAQEWKRSRLAASAANERDRIMGQLKLTTIIEEDSGTKSRVEASTKVTLAESSTSNKKGTTAPKTKYESPQ